VRPTALQNARWIDRHNACSPRAPCRRDYVHPPGARIVARARQARVWSASRCGAKQLGSRRTGDRVVGSKISFHRSENQGTERRSTPGDEERAL